MENKNDASLVCGPRGWRVNNDRNTSTETQRAMDRSELCLEERSENTEVNDLVQGGHPEPPEMNPRWVRGIYRE